MEYLTPGQEGIFSSWEVRLPLLVEATMELGEVQEYQRARLVPASSRCFNDRLTWMMHKRKARQTGKEKQRTCSPRNRPGNSVPSLFVQAFEQSTSLNDELLPFCRRKVVTTVN